MRMRFLKRWKTRILIVAAVMGPGIITANVDNDAGGIFTYSAAGAQFGHLLLWTIIPTTIALIVVQEMSARMGAVTGKGLSDLIREEFGFLGTPIRIQVRARRRKEMEKAAEDSGRHRSKTSTGAGARKGSPGGVKRTRAAASRPRKKR